MTVQTKPTSGPLLDPLGASPSLVLLQYDLASSCVPVLRQLVEDALASQTQVVFVSLLLSPSHYLGTLSSPFLKLLDHSEFAPGYSDDQPDVLSQILTEITSGPTVLVIDSLDTLSGDLGSQSRTLDFLSRAFGHVVQQSSSSRLILPIRSNSHILPSLLSTSFQARVSRTEKSTLPLAHTLTHLIFHPPILFSHLIQHYHVSLPPVNSPPEASTARFWSVFAPVASRGTGEQLVMAAGVGQLGGTSTPSSQFTLREANFGVAELIIRARTGGQKGVRRVLKGWRLDREGGRVVWCSWDDIPTMKVLVITSVTSVSTAPDAMESVSFNLQLSDAQQQARANVPLPYANDGLQAFGASQDGEIHYIPDQADDFDDDDPDDDLYI